jgi:hypothetical protein
MIYGKGHTNSDSTLGGDIRRTKTKTKTCIDCGCSIKRGLRCAPCRDIADGRRYRPVVLVENTPAGTFFAVVDLLALDNWQEHEALYPDSQSIVEMPYPRAKAHRQVPWATRELLAERAAVLMGGTQAVAA